MSINVIINYLLLVIFLNSFVLGSAIGSTDSILWEQKKSLDGICTQLKNINNSIKNIEYSDSLYVSNQRTIVDSILNSHDSIFIENKLIGNEKSVCDFLYNSFAELFGALLGAGIALLLFYRQNRKDERERDEKSREKMLLKNRYLVQTLMAVLDVGEKYRASAADFSRDVEQNPIEIPELTKYPIQDLKRLQNIVDDDQYYYSFIETYGSDEFAINAFRKIANISNYLESQLPQFMFQDYIEKDFARKNRFKELFTILFDGVHEIGVSSEEENPVLYQEIEEILGNYYRDIKRNQYDITYHMDNFITPLKGLLLAKYFDDKEMRSKLMEIRTIELLYKDIIAQNLRVAERFVNFSDTMDQVMGELRKLLTDLRIL